MRHVLPSCAAALVFAAAVTGARAADPMRTGAAGSTATQTLAETIAAMPKGIERAEGPPLAASIAAAQAAVAACTAHKAKVSVLIADSAGEPVVVLSGDGAGVRSRLIAESKVATVMHLKMSSIDAANRAEHDARLKAQAAADPDIGMLRGGGYAVVKDGRTIGYVGVSGATIYGAEGWDEKCAEIAVKALGGT